MIIEIEFIENLVKFLKIGFQNLATNTLCFCKTHNCIDRFDVNHIFAYSHFSWLVHDIELLSFCCCFSGNQNDFMLLDNFENEFILLIVIFIAVVKLLSSLPAR